MSRFTIESNATAFSVEFTDKQMQSTVQKMLISNFLDEYNKRNRTKMTVYNVFNIRVDGERRPQSTKAVLEYPLRTLAMNGGETRVTIDLVESAHVSVSCGETYSSVDLEAKFLKSTVMDAIVSPFLTHYNQQNGTKKTKSALKGLVFDGETPMEKLSTVTSMKMHAVINDPKHTEIRILLD